MYSYSFRNNKKINKNTLINKFINIYQLNLIDDTETNTVIGNNEVMIDFGKKYIFILLFNENLNISNLIDDLLRTTND